MVLILIKHDLALKLTFEKEDGLIGVKNYQDLVWTQRTQGSAESAKKNRFKLAAFQFNLFFAYSGGTLRSLRPKKQMRG